MPVAARRGIREHLNVNVRNLLILAPMLTCTLGCAYFTSATVGVKRVGANTVERELDQSALTGDEPSDIAEVALHLEGLTERYAKDPAGALIELHHHALDRSKRAFVYALAELSYLAGKRLNSREHYAAAAVYAYSYLFGDEWGTPPNPYDRRFRWACELYNRGLREALLTADRSRAVVESGRWSLPIGHLDVSVDASGLPFPVEDFEFLAADEYEVWGLSFRVRDSGLGVPLIARSAGRAESGSSASHRFRHHHVPVTCFLRLTGGLRALDDGTAASLELRSAYETQSVSVDGREIPLESDLSAALAHSLERSNLWTFSLSGFFEGSKSLAQNGVKLPQPYRPGRIPVVFVHGTASNPGNWAEMFNLLESDRELREHYQFWFYLYSTGNPVTFTAARLRKELTELVESLDPDHRDPALRRMVLIGHSQGGLLCKLQVVHGELAWWNEVFGVPLDQSGLTSEQIALIRPAIDFEPLPFVQRVVFLATPHRGSYQADRWLSHLISLLIALPKELMDLREVFDDNPRLPRNVEAKLLTSLDSMKTSNPMLRLLAAAPIAPGVQMHSIIPIGDADPEHPERAADGVVEYESAHIDGVASELVIPGGHSCQSSTPAILEVWRILHEHLAQQRED